VDGPIVRDGDYSAFVSRQRGRFSFRVAAVSGATGFVGSHLIGLLRLCGIKVRALVRGMPTAPHLNGDGIETFPGDVRSRATSERLVEGADVVFHTAAMVAPWVEHSEEQYEVAIQGTQRMLEAAEQRRIPVVCTSSISVLDPVSLPRYVRLVDGNHYVRSKRRALEAVRRARQRGVAASTIIPSGIIGPGDYRPTAIGQIVRSTMHGGGPLVSFDGGIYLVDIRDVVEAHLLAAVRDLPDDYVIPGEYWPLRNFFGAIRRRARVRKAQFEVPLALALGGAAVLSAWSRLVTRRAPIITPAWVCHFSAAARTSYRSDADRLGLSPRPIASSIAEAVAWYGAC